MPDRSRPARLPLALARSAGLLTMSVLPWSGAGAQWIGGIGEDALVLPRGTVRVTVQGINQTHDERRSSGADGAISSARVPLGAELSADALGAAEVPALATLQARLRTLTGVPDLSVSLGRLAVRADARRSEIPVRLEVGVGSRLQLSVMVPYVQTRVAVQVTGDPTAAQGNLGPNPALSSGDAAAVNAALVAQLRAAAGELRARLADCDSDPSAPTCLDRAAAEQLNAAVEGFADGVAAVYGTTAEAGGPFVPVLGTPLAGSVAQRIAGFREAYLGYGVDVIAAGVAPQGAAGGAPPELVRSALAGGALGTGLQELREVRRYGVGDVEVGARFRLLGPSAGDLGAAGTERRLLARASVGALVRLGTGRPDEPLNLLDVGTGDGQHDVEVQLAADVRAGPRLATSIVARYGVQLPDELDRLVPAVASTGYVPAENLARVKRDLGDYVELEVTPRYALTELVALGAHYRFRAKGADSYELPLQPPTATGAASMDVDLLELGTETREHLAGLGVVLSTLPAYARGRASVPLEVSYRHSRTIRGAGRLTPHGWRDELALRLYVSLFGGR